MFKIIVFNGGLGNQMFQYAFYLRLKNEYPFSLFLFDITQSQECHYGYELDKYFHINSVKNIKRYEILNNLTPIVNNAFHKIKQDYSLKYTPKLIFSNYTLLRYEGYWQSEKYFLSIESQIRKVFSFSEKYLSTKTKELTSLLKQTNSVSIHIRRGDYLPEIDNRGICSLNYYTKAIAYIRDNVKDPFFVIFSDDLEWVRNNLKCNNSVFIDWNQGNDSWQDMYLMSQCKHNIIANSSFSWWGAWLNQNPRRIVIAPTPWFNNTPDFDIIPSNWILINR